MKEKNIITKACVDELRRIYCANGISIAEREGIYINAVEVALKSNNEIKEYRIIVIGNEPS